MRRKHYRELRAGLEAEVEEMEARAAEARRKLEALDLVWNDILNAGQDEQSAHPLEESTLRGRVARLVTEAVEQVSGQFRVADIEQLILRNHPDTADDQINRTTISGRLTRLCRDNGPLEIVMVGSGRRPTVYQKRNNSSQETELPELKIM